MRCAFLFVLFLLSSAATFSQIKVTKLNSKQLPGSVRYKGELIDAVQWTDVLGANLVITARAEIVTKTTDENDTKGVELFANHYLLKDDSTLLMWKLYDFNKDCMFDLNVGFIDKTFAITDIDKNGKAEVWLMYKNQCTSDVSPAPTKIIMYENGRKYALRGTSRVQISATEFMGGSFSFDDAFKNGPVAFRQHAQKLWDQNRVQKWE
jgi:hypothetical protein